MLDEASAETAVVAHSEDAYLEGCGGICADVEGEWIACADGSLGNVSFDPWTTVFGGCFCAGFCEAPIEGSLVRVFLLDEVVGGCGCVGEDRRQQERWRGAEQVATVEHGELA
ncbi:MAG: hypothetical protein RIS92_3237 [Verrucomicrobiota bacterium]